ncbi:MAG TPA: PHP domain-containing protein, partial [Verrucomicrobiae bacterium]|nr:PHP domain-containing protein [Verrucomicrobiae bacterium]
MEGFAHLHVHSSCSAAWGVHPPEDLCTAAKGMGVTRLALTDRNGLYAIPRFLEAAREAGVRPIIGAEAVTRHRAVLLARDASGYANLCRLLSELHCSAGFDLPEAISRYRRGLVVLTDDPGVLRPLCRRSREGLFVELSPGHGMHRALAMAAELRLPPVAACRGTFLQESDYHLHRVLRGVHLNT